MKIAAWVAVVLFLIALVIALLQAPRAAWNTFIAAGLTAFALAYALSISHITIS